MQKTLKILGTRGIPARHGGFETFAEDLALYLVGRNWRVTVYCQEDGEGPIVRDTWRGVDLVKIPVKTAGAVGTVVFDWKATRHAAGDRGLALTLGYNTAVFCALLRLGRTPNLINMDGREWKRDKYGLPQKGWLFVNEIAGSRLGNHLIADHPEIKRQIRWQSRDGKITTIPYGARPIAGTDPAPLREWGLEPNGYAAVIARPEPENSILEIVRSFSAKERGCRLVVLGTYEPGKKYPDRVKNAASKEVVFPGAIYEKHKVEALREHAKLYVHGHTVGGTNPSLVEALAAGSPVLAHDNAFNRWVAGDEAGYFGSEEECRRAFDELLDDRDRLERMREASRRRHQEAFTLERCLGAYEELLSRWAMDES